MKKLVLMLLVMGACFSVCSMAHGEWSDLPSDLNIIRPGSEVPPEIAAFSGIWQGEVRNARGFVTGNMQIVVESIERVDSPAGTSYRATVMYYWQGNAYAAGLRTPRLQVIIKEGHLIIQIPRNNATVDGILVGTEMHATYNSGVGIYDVLLFREK